MITSSTVKYTTPAGYGWKIAKQLLNEHHVCIGGTTGSGKSVFLRSILFTAHQQSPATYQFYYIDLKRVELRDWEKMPHCLGYADTIDGAVEVLNKCITIMEYRYEEMASKGLRTWDGNHIWIVVDEVADLLHQSKEVLRLMCEIGRLGRAARIHLMICTQNPSRSSGGGLPAPLIQNMTACVALRCRSAIESRQIIGIAGAELLPRHGQGYLWNSNGTELVNIPMTDEKDIQERQKYWITNYPKNGGLLDHIRPRKRISPETRRERKRKPFFWPF